jgi:hypothetical protein
MARGRERAAARRRFHDHHPQRDPGDEPVALLTPLKVAKG